MSRAIQRMYTRIDRGYELVNHLFSWGLDISWRRRAARRAGEVKGQRWLDLCTGTGEMARDLKRLVPQGSLVVGADFSMPMLKMAKSKRAGEQTVELILAEAEHLPFDAQTFDVVTLSFATRNLAASGSLPTFFREVHRVLRPGGRLIHLETSQPENRFVNLLFRHYVGASVPTLGTLVTGASGPYRFLSKSVQRFHGRDELGSLLREGGFEKVACRPLMLGAVAIHEAVK